MYTITDVTDRFSADHITTLGAATFPTPKPDEIYLMNGMENFNTSPSQILIAKEMGSRPMTVAPKERRAIGTGNYTNLKRRRKTSGLASLTPSSKPMNGSDFGFVKVNIPGIELDENVETAIAGLGSLVAAGVGLYALYFVAKPVLGIIGDTRRAFKA